MLALVALVYPSPPVPRRRRKELLTIVEAAHTPKTAKQEPRHFTPALALAPLLSLLQIIPPSFLLPLPLPLPLAPPPWRVFATLLTGVRRGVGGVFGYSDGDAVVGMLAAAWLMAEHGFEEAAAAAWVHMVCQSFLGVLFTLSSYSGPR